jgi:hypothetical protein
MTLTKEDIWERLRTDSVWVTGVLTQITPLPAPTNVLARQFRIIPMIWIPGNGTGQIGVQFLKLEADGVTYTVKFCPIQVAASPGAIQIPGGAYDVENPILTLEGGTRLFGQCSTAGTSVNVTIEYWDLDI